MDNDSSLPSEYPTNDGEALEFIFDPEDIHCTVTGYAFYHFFRTRMKLSPRWALDSTLKYLAAEEFMSEFFIIGRG